jgi:hypothetical protein
MGGIVESELELVQSQHIAMVADGVSLAAFSNVFQPPSLATVSQAP